MKGTATAEDLYSALDTALEKKNIPLSKLCGIATDGAPSMRGNRSGLTTLLAKKLKTEFSRELFVCHCVIHIENLCAKNIQFQNVMEIVISTVNFIRSKALNHRQFMDFLADMDAEYGDVIYFSEVRWLSRAKVLKRFLNILPEVKIFMDMKGKHIPQFDDNCSVGDLAFLISYMSSKYADVIEDLSSESMKVKERDTPLVGETYENVKTLFELTKVNEIPFKFNSDLKLILIINGQQTATATYPCPYCFITLSEMHTFGKLTGDADKEESMEIDVDDIILKTFKNLKDDYNKFKCFGKDKKYAKECHSTTMNKIVHDCFSTQRADFTDLDENLKKFRKNLESAGTSQTLKMHIILDHLKEGISLLNNDGLGLWSEQSVKITQPDDASNGSVFNTEPLEDVKHNGKSFRPKITETNAFVQAVPCEECYLSLKMKKNMNSTLQPEQLDNSIIFIKE
ncbi:hypothetical protein CBL_08394 [Carabus blaptoides fortunei]